MVVLKIANATIIRVVLVVLAFYAGFSTIYVSF